MNLSDMLALVRTDLHDFVAADYRWTDEELTRHIQRAVGEFSLSMPLASKTALPTIAGSREVDISGLNDRITVAAVAYPADHDPPEYRQFSVWGDTLLIADGALPDGSDCAVYYGAKHTLTAESSTVPETCEDIISEGAAGYAALSRALFTINKVNLGGARAPDALLEWGSRKLRHFQEILKQLGLKNRVRVSTLFNPDAE